MSRAETTSTINSTSPNWWETFFDDFYADFGLASTSAETNEQIVDFLCDHLELEEGDTVFDQCCGIGRLAIPLAQRGVNVIGIDLTASYIERARTAAENASVDDEAEFHCADAFEYITPHPCDAAMNWFTSFGYHEDDTVNRKMFTCAFESLKPGGRFAVEIPNYARVMREFRPSHVQREQTDRGEVILLDEPTIHFARGVIEARWTFILPDGSRDERRIFTRIIMPDRLRVMLEKAGFTDVQIIGWPDGEPLTLASRRCVAAARKPE